MLCAGDCEAVLGFFVSFFSTATSLTSAIACPFASCAFFPFSDTGVPPVIVLTEATDTP